MYYVEHRDNLLNNKSLRNTVVPIDKLYEKVDPYLDNYRGLFYYSDDILKHVADNNTVSGFKGKSFAPYLVWDFDSSEPEEARTDAMELIGRLIDNYDVQEDEIAIFFSGKKGFHIEVSTAGIKNIGDTLHENTPVHIRKICLTIADGLKTLDRGIYNLNRLYRISGTLHNKETDVDGKLIKLFKTNLTPEFLFNNDIKSIQKYAVELRMPEKVNAVSKPDKLSKLAQKVINQIKDLVKETIDLPTLNQEGLSDENLAPIRTKICQWRIQQGDYTEGRNNALLRAAVHEKQQGKPREVVKYTLMGILEVMNQRDPKKAQLDPITDFEIETIVRQAFEKEFEFGCNDIILGDTLCSKKCYLAPAKFNESKAETKTILEAYHNSKVFFKNYYENIVPTGFKILDEKMPLFLNTFNLIVGIEGVGKTALLLNILKSASQSDLPALLFNMDMGQEMLVQKFAPILIADKKHISSKDFMESFARNDTALIKLVEDEFTILSDKILISSQRTISVKDIEKEIDIREKMWGKKIKLIMVDYVQLLKSEKEGYHGHTANAEDLASLAKKRGVCILGLSQTSRAYRNGNQEQILAQGSGAWEQQASTQMNCFRPYKETHPDYDYFISVKMMKNRLGSCDRVDLFFDTPSGVIRDLTKEEALQLEAIKQSVEADEQ